MSERSEAGRHPGIRQTLAVRGLDDMVPTRLPEPTPTLDLVSEVAAIVGEQVFCVSTEISGFAYDPKTHQLLQRKTRDGKIRVEIKSLA